MSCRPLSVPALFLYNNSARELTLPFSCYTLFNKLTVDKKTMFFLHLVPLNLRSYKLFFSLSFHSPHSFFFSFVLFILFFISFCFYEYSEDLCLYSFTFKLNTADKIAIVNTIQFTQFIQLVFEHGEEENFTAAMIAEINYLFWSTRRSVSPRTIFALLEVLNFIRITIKRGEKEMR